MTITTESQKRNVEYQLVAHCSEFNVRLQSLWLDSIEHNLTCLKWYFQKLLFCISYAK